MAQKKFVYATAANGMEVRIPADKYPQWKEAQDKLRAGTMKADPQMTAQLRSLMEQK